MKSMMMVVLACIVLAGCAGAQSTTPTADDVAWGRFDCRRGHAVDLEFEQAKAVCSNTANAQGVAAAAPAHGVVAGAFTQVSVADSTMKACMAERGFVLAKRGEYDRQCGPAPAH